MKILGTLLVLVVASEAALVLETISTTIAVNDAIAKLTQESDADKITASLKDIHTTLERTQRRTENLLKAIVADMKAQKLITFVGAVKTLERDILTMTDSISNVTKEEALHRFIKLCQTTHVPDPMSGDLLDMLGDGSGLLQLAIENDPFYRFEAMNDTAYAVIDLFKRLAMLQNHFHVLLDHEMPENELNPIEKRMNDGIAMMQSFMQSYKMRSNYWGKVPEYIQMAIDQDLEKNETKRAEHLRDMLSQIYTTDQFVIIAYAEASCTCKVMYAHKNFYQLAYSPDKNTLVYRSMTAYQKNVTALSDLRSAMLKKHLSDDFYHYEFGTCPQPEKLKYVIENQGFLAIIPCNHAIMATGPFPKGPGTSTPIKFKIPGTVQVRLRSKMMKLFCALE